jgi:hypothetical protein
MEGNAQHRKERANVAKCIVSIMLSVLDKHAWVY